MPRINTPGTNSVEPSGPRARRGPDSKAAVKKGAQQKGKVVKNRQQSRSDRATSTPSKQQLCLELLRRPDGARVEELQAATGWQPHSVLVLDDGFEYRGAHFRSLSQIARTITRARWSGPRFFGLKRRSKPFVRSAEAAHA